MLNTNKLRKRKTPFIFNPLVAQIPSRFLSLSPDFIGRVVTILTHHVNTETQQKYFLLFLLVFQLFFNISYAQIDELNEPESSQTESINIDQRAWLVGRTYPAGAQAFYTIGTNHLVWGDSSSWKYGYVRAAFNAATSFVINRVGVEFQMYPISIFGLSAGYDWGWRSIQMKFADCSTYECMGRVDRAYVKAQMFAAFKGLIFMGNLRYEQLRHVSNQQMFFDEVTLLPCSSKEERVFMMNPSLMHSISDSVKIGATSLLVRGITSKTLSHMYGPVAQYTINSRTNFALGLGQNHSTVVHSALTAFFMLSYTIDPSLSVMDLAIRQGK